MNTDPRCVQWSADIFKQKGKANQEQIDQLVWCLTQEQFYFENGAARNALALIGEPAVSALVEGLESPLNNQSEGSALTLGDMGSKARKAIPALKAILLKKPVPGMLQPFVARAIGKIGEIDYLIRISKGDIAGIPPYLGYEGLGEMGAEAAPAIPYLKEIARSGNVSAGEALAKIGTPEALAASRSFRWKESARQVLIIVLLIMLSPIVSAGIGIGFALWGWLGFHARPSGRFAYVILCIPAILWTFYAICAFSHILRFSRLFYLLLAILTILPLVFCIFDLVFRRRTHSSKSQK